MEKSAQHVANLLFAP